MLGTLVRNVAAVAVVAVLLSALGTSAAAQETDETIEYLVTAILCPEGIDAPCDPAVGVVISATTPDGEALGTCTTEEMTIQDSVSGRCFIELPLGAEVVLAEDPATLPAGYVPQDSPKTIIAEIDPDCEADCIAGTGFVNVLQAEPTATAEPTQGLPTATAEPARQTETPDSTGGGAVALPDTGAGSAQMGVPTRTALVLLLSISALLLGGMATRRMRVG
ncbi:MAG TPA: hypothetical protein VGR16_03555 [Thermomicrobiales bacterium]|nr:hypothetical protein [Thermomicrobiales bacterium]